MRADTKPKDEGGPLVTFRSMAGNFVKSAFVTIRPLSQTARLVLAANVKYIWPLQAPLSDAGAQRKRLNAVRQQLGWQVIGCDYIECFQ